MYVKIEAFIDKKVSTEKKLSLKKWYVFSIFFIFLNGHSEKFPGFIFKTILLYAENIMLNVLQQLNLECYLSQNWAGLKNDNMKGKSGYFDVLPKFKQL